MRKEYLFMLIVMLSFVINVKAQNNSQILIEDNFSDYTVGNKLALEAMEAGNDWWTTLTNSPGGYEDALIVEYNDNKCAYLTFGVDQVLLLGDRVSGCYDIEFDILIPEGKNGYFNVFHDFNLQNPSWSLETFLHMSDIMTEDPGYGTIKADGHGTKIKCIYDDWIHFRLHINIEANLALYYYTLPGEDEELALKWKWSLDSYGYETTNKLDAVDFFPYMNAETSEFYLDNIKITQLYPSSNIDVEEISVVMQENEESVRNITIENTGVATTAWMSWIDYGVGENSDATNVVNYDGEVGPTSIIVGYSEEVMLTEIGAMYPAKIYGETVMGAKITKAQYFMRAHDGEIGIVPNTPLVFRIYGPGFNGQPGEILAEKVLPADEIVSDGWNSVTFDEPVELTGFDVWATVEFTEDIGGYPMNFDGLTASQYGGFWRSHGIGAFENTSWWNYGNVHIRITCSGTPVENGWANLSKQEGLIDMGLSDEVSVMLNTSGLSDGDVVEANIIVKTNDFDNELVSIPLTLKVNGVNVEEVLSEAYNIFPNPTSGLVTIEAENINYIAIYNSVGQLVNVVKSENNTVDMSSYDNGVYYFNIVDNAGQNSLQRVVVAK